LTLINLRDGDTRFHLRVAAVCIHDGHVLLQASGDPGQYILPGGHGEVLEPTAESVRREMQEEYGVEVEVGRLLWIVENFFTDDGVRTHQLGVIYEVHLPPGCYLLDTTREYAGDDVGTPFVARWFPIATLSDTLLVPSFLRAALSQLPHSQQHVVHYDVPRQ
jgi:ADP-ribose pyrophosphatase YjhB (NUDIX family)